ncbi:MAG: GNAT family N-acetyltransferase [Isosphaeraceae bacterium]|nr:GNAT family N-acetyltransferase [Isosphaeraceae bacterium]
MTSNASSSSSAAIAVRDAGPADLETVVEFNSALALETEGKQLDRVVLTRGVAAAIADPDRLHYWVAVDRDSGRVLGQAAVTREWSDWRGGWIWWFQSVYVVADARGRGVFRTLHAHVRNQAIAAEDVIGLRLYVEVHNHRAQAAYRALGFEPGGYDVFEELWPERFGSA